MHTAASHKPSLDCDDEDGAVQVCRRFGAKYASEFVGNFTFDSDGSDFDLSEFLNKQKAEKAAENRPSGNEEFDKIPNPVILATKVWDQRRNRWIFPLANRDACIDVDVEAGETDTERDYRRLQRRDASKCFIM